MEDWVKILLTGLLTLLASSGFWSYRTKKLERKYQKEDKSNEFLKRLDQLVEAQNSLSNKLDTLIEKHTKTDAVTMAVARDRIYYLCKKWVREKNLDADNMRDVESLLRPYKENGGNGIADEYFERYEHMYKTSGGQY